MEIYLPDQLYKALADFILCDDDARRALGIEQDALSVCRNEVMLALAEKLDLYPAEARQHIEADAA